MESPDAEEEIRHLRRCLRDVVAMTMLPSVWTGYDVTQICRDLADVVLRAVDADAVLLTARSRGTVDILRLRDESDQEAARALREAAMAPMGNEAHADAGGRKLRILCYPLSASADDRLIAAAYRPEFATEFEKLLLRVAANQAAILIEQKDAEAQQKRAERDSRFLAEAGEILGQSLDVENTLQSVSALLAVPRIADWCFVDLVDGDGGFQRVAVAHADPADAAIAQTLRRFYAPPNAPYGILRTFTGKQTVLRNDVTQELLIALARDDEHRDALLAMGMHAFVSVPMTSRGKTFGVITFCGTKSKPQFGPADVALAEELARRAALAVDNARLYRAAQEANRAKDEFLATLSHELRTPMTAILGWAHLLQLGGIDEAEMRVGIDTIRQSGQAQARLIDELLDVSRIVTGKLHLVTAVVALPDIVRNAVAAIRPAADAKRQRLELDIADSDSADLRVLGDASRLQQVFWNLLSNAVKFTPPGGSIRVRVAREEASVQVTVTDNGEGIPAELLSQVFERFRQASASAGRRSGLGLGLAIAKELIELHGGTITAQSAGKGHGSTFAVTLPLHAEEKRTPAKGVAAASGRQRLRAVRVLLVEDDEVTRTLLATLLRSFGAEVMPASSAAEARKALESFRCDVLISDIEMPDDDGVVLLQSLRGDGERRFPAIAVTGYADESNRHRVLAAGFDGFVAKPLDPNALADEIERLTGVVHPERAKRVEGSS